MPRRRRTEPESTESNSSAAALFKTLQEEYRKLREQWGKSYSYAIGDEASLRVRVHQKLTAREDPGPLDVEGEAACGQILDLASWGPDKEFPRAMIRYWILSSGGGFAVRAAARTWAYERPTPHHDKDGVATPHDFPKLSPRKSWHYDPDKLGTWHALRAEFEAADPAAYSEARGAAMELRTRAIEIFGDGALLLKAALSYAFPREPDWAAADADDLLLDRNHHHYWYRERHPWCLLASLRDVERADRIIATWAGYTPPRLFEFAPALKTNLGSAAFGPLRRLASGFILEKRKVPVYKILSQFETPEAALWFAQNLEGSRALAAEAAAYLTRHVSLAIPALASMLAVSKTDGNAAAAILTRHLSESREAVEAALAGMSDEDRSRVERLGRKLQRLEELRPSEENTECPGWLVSSESKLPRKMPAFWTPSLFPRPLVNGGRALSSEAVETLGAMLKASTLTTPHVGVVKARSGLDFASTAEFVWAIFTAWLGAQCPSDERWAFDALAHLGGDEAARRLAPLLKDWAAKGATPRAKSAVEVLGKIGTDLSLSYVQRLAETSKNKPLRKKAGEVLESVALERGLTRDDLEDRLVPDLGLDASGFRVLDFGPRSFRAGFDSRLKPIVFDDAGARRDRLPPARKTDDAEKAGRAQREWKAVTKDAEALFKAHGWRLEGAMCSRRVWKHDAWKEWASHPLMRHLVRCVVWEARTATGETIGTFRVTEDGSLADEKDGLFRPVLSFGCTVPHPLSIPSKTLASWRTIFNDYEILQPFPQLGRDFYPADEKELGSYELARVDGRQTTANRLMGIRHRGWREGYGLAGPSGTSGIFKRIPGGSHTVFLAVEGTKLGRAYLNRGEEGEKKARFRELDPVWFSEVVRDMEWLTIVA